MTSTAMNDPLLGRMLLGRYRIVRTLARGGMGVVYLGRVEGAAGFAKPVVIKTVIPQLSGDSHLEQMFVREAQIVSNLVHPNIVGVIDFGEADGAYLMVLEYVHGFHLGQWLRYVASARGQMPVVHAVHIVGKVLDALQYAHTLARPDGTPFRIVHRDVSPPNILIDVQGRVRLHDFGVARMANEAGEYKTQDGAFRGTLSYAAPETVQGSPASVQSDLYSCGIVLYQLLAGSNPLRGNDPNETLYRVLHHVPPPVMSLRPDVPEAISVAIDRVISKDPIDRFETAAEFASALREGLAWDEAQALADFCAAVEGDFQGEMAGQLGLVPLDVRDAAWRESLRASTIPPIPLDSSPPVHISDSPAPPRVSDATTLAESKAVPQIPRPEWKITRPDEPTRTAPLPKVLPRKSTRPWLVLGGFGAVLAIGVGVWLATRGGAPPASQFVMIERTASSGEPSTSAPSDLPSSAVPSGPVGQAASPDSVKPVETRPTEPAGTAHGSDSQRLSRAFQRQQGKIEACFRAHPGDLAHSPQLSVRFQIDASGKVTSAQIVPASLAGSALGSCVTSVASATDFGAQAAPIAFTIPINARRVTN
jgi:serine/threonine-protein kinase